MKGSCKTSDPTQVIVEELDTSDIIHRPKSLTFTAPFCSFAGIIYVARKHRGIIPGAYYHICNRATEQRLLFKAKADYELWIRTLKEALEKYPLNIYAFCVMPNHWHILASCSSRKLFMRAMQWLGATHAIRWRKRAESVGKGAVYQSRYRCHRVKPNQIFWVVARYIERNPVRASLTDSPFAWEWSSAGQKKGGEIPMYEWPIPKPTNWEDFLKRGGDPVEESQIREALIRGQPFFEFKKRL